MTDTPVPMGKKLRKWLLAYLLVSSAIFIQFIYGVWNAVPSVGSPLDPAQFTSGESNGDNPELLALDPDRITIGTPQDTIRVFGRNFTNQSKVGLGDAPGVFRSVQFISQSEMVVSIDSSKLATPRAIPITVTNGAVTSNAMTLAVAPPTEQAGEWTLFWRWKTRVSTESRLMLLVLLIGALAACVSALKSMADYRGNKKLYERWAMFYVVQPPLGAGIAFLFYLVIRGGLFAGTQVDFGTTTPYGILAIAALVGMFADRAHKKLLDIFDAMFTSKSEDERSDKLAKSLSIKTTKLGGASVNQVYAGKMEATGGKEPYTWSSDALPTGLTLDAKTGEITGKPTVATQKKPYKFTVTDAAGKVATATIELEVT